MELSLNDLMSEFFAYSLVPRTAIEFSAFKRIIDIYGEQYISESGETAKERYEQGVRSLVHHRKELKQARKVGAILSLYSYYRQIGHTPDKVSYLLDYFEAIRNRRGYAHWTGESAIKHLSCKYMLCQFRRSSHLIEGRVSIASKFSSLCVRISKVVGITAIACVMATFAQAMQYYSSLEDVRAVIIEQYKTSNPNQIEVVNQFESECLYFKQSRILTKEEAEAKLSQRPVGLYECGANIGAHGLMSELRKSESYLSTVSFPLSAFTGS